MRVVIPFDATDPKSRLAEVLDPAERGEFARAMLEDVLAAVRATGEEPIVVATEPIDVPVSTRVDDRPLTPLVDAEIDAATPVAVVMADLAIATPTALERLFETPGDVVMAPGRGGGTNAIVVRDPTFRVDYHGASYRDHLRNARAVGASVGEVDSFRLSTDVDDVDDLIEVLLHGDGRATRWLRDAGFRIDATGGRPTVARE